MKSLYIPLFVIVVILALCLCIIEMRLYAEKSEESKTVFNDVKVITNSEGKPLWPEYVPVVSEEDKPFIVDSPPHKEVDSCVEWLGCFINKNFVPDDIQNNLIALKGWPKFKNADVFVTWYVVDSRLIYIIDALGEVVIFTTPVSEEPEGVADEETTEVASNDNARGMSPNECISFVLSNAESLLAKEILPHPETPARGGKQSETFLTAGSWLPAVLDITRDEEGCLSSNTPDFPTADSINFLTDGKFVQFRIIKLYVPGMVFPNRYRARFDVPPAEKPSERIEHEPEPVIKEAHPVPESDNETE